MVNSKDDNNNTSISMKEGKNDNNKEPQKGPVSFLSGALTSLIMAWFCLLISKKILVYFAVHTISYSSPIAQSVASGFKTLIIGISFLATFSFAFIGLGLTLVFIRSLVDVILKRIAKVKK